MDFLLGPAGTLNVSALQRFDSGLPYSASAFITAAADPADVTRSSNEMAGSERAGAFFFWR
jgi:hypothetical protein